MGLGQLSRLLLPTPTAGETVFVFPRLVQAIEKRIPTFPVAGYMHLPGLLEMPPVLAVDSAPYLLVQLSACVALVRILLQELDDSLGGRSLGGCSRDRLVSRLVLIISIFVVLFLLLLLLQLLLLLVLVVVLLLLDTPWP